MKGVRMNLQCLRRLYGVLLWLYPKGYREEYGSELQTVFDLSLDEAMNGGWFEAVGVVLQELAGLPKAVIYQHLRERRNAKRTAMLRCPRSKGHQIIFSRLAWPPASLRRLSGSWSEGSPGREIARLRE
jgi:hypothetical protein